MSAIARLLFITFFILAGFTSLYPSFWLHETVISPRYYSFVKLITAHDKLSCMCRC